LFFNIETAITGLAAKDDAAAAESRLENELLTIINVLTIITNGNDELANARRYDRCHQDKRWLVHRRQFCSLGKLHNYF
jgi:hypothetical protein|tara:strand:+ start:293 stop:529 length:237 start_codon:yes stop_codon:yes gene_type:complete